ncbi:MAG: thioredoxin family protein [Candidatus Nitrosocaldaceae archaeon]|nr:MAG: thioredoxin family protein [Candidatus Nitrosocaldaceae archaeon]
MARTLSMQKLKKGDKAPNFRLLGVDGKYYTLDDFNADALLIVFMCNHCPFVHARLDDIKELQEKFKDRLQVIGINSNDPNYEGEGYENMKKFAEEKQLNFPYLFDETQEVARAYGATCTPDPFLFDKDKRLVFHGRINDAMDPEAKPTIPVMEINIRKLLNGEEIEKDFDPSIGCSIKWKD